LRIYFSRSTLWNETISENMDTGPAKCLIPQMSTALEMVELETHMETESSNLTRQVDTAVDEVGLKTNTGTSESRAMIPPLTTALTTNTGTEAASWICRVHDALLRDDDANDFSKLVVCWNVPDYIRTGSDHFDPQSWRFGLHNRAPDTLQTDGTELFKIQVARALGLTGDRWIKFCKDVVIEEKSHWEVVYGQSPDAKSHSIADIRCLLALDALFLVIWMQMRGGGIKSLSPPLQEVMGTQVMRVHLTQLWCSDFYLVDNQIPMVLLERVVGNLRTGGCKFIEAWEHKQWQGRNIGNCVRWTTFDRPGISEAEYWTILKKRMEERLRQEGGKLGGAPHILDKSYRILCGHSHGDHDKNYQRVPSATYLEACGVRIKGKEFTCFEDISFERGCLWIPFLRIYDTTERYLRNLVVHEELTYSYSRCCARSYTIFMRDLMKTTEDVDLLVKEGVVEVHVGTHDIVVDMWKTINYRINTPDLTEEFFSTLTKVNKYVGQERHKLWFEFLKLFCSRPWFVLSVIAATLVTIATLIQTYVSVISSNGMQPHFPPH
jgi:hypothetical protein